MYFNKWVKMNADERGRFKYRRQRAIANFTDFVSKIQDSKKKSIITPSTTVLHPTGYSYLDYGTGSWLNTYDDDGMALNAYKNYGVPGGAVVTVFAKTQGGKSTIAFQACIDALQPWIVPSTMRRYIEEHIPPKERVQWSDGDVFVHVLDAEHTADANYFAKIGRMSPVDLKRYVAISDVSTDKDVMQCLQAHARYKVETMVPEYAKITDVYGHPFKEYPLTAMIIDSTSQLIVEEVDDITNSKKGGLVDVYESASRGSAGAQRARVINQLYTQMTNYASKYNILIVNIVHINKAPSMMGMPTRSSRMLNMGEAISGGERQLYLSMAALRIDVIKNVGGQSSSAVNLGDGITGFIAKMDWRKSKCNSKRNVCQMVYTNEGGYDQILSGLWQAKENNALSKKGNLYYLDRYPDYRFPLKYHQVHEIFSDHPEMFTAYADQISANAEPLLDNLDSAMRWDRKLMDEARDNVRRDFEDGLLTSSDAMDLDDMFSSMINS